MKPKLLIVHGPNLNLLGSRKVEIYGKQSLEELNRSLQLNFNQLVSLDFFQSNAEGDIINLIQSKSTWMDGLVINPAAYTHYSIAIRDCIEAIPKPAVEVHLSNIYEREPFRAHSVIKDVCLKQFYGKGVRSYEEAILFLSDYLKGQNG